MRDLTFPSGCAGLTIFATTVLLLLFGLPHRSDAKGFFSRESKDAALPVSICTEEKDHGRTFVKGRVLIKAPANVVWLSVHEERKKDPDLAYSKVLDQAENHYTLEQKFTLIPVIGTSVCIMSDTEVPLERIDYKLVKSDRFKSLEGSWVLTPCQEGKATFLELSSHIDFGMPVPKAILNSLTARKLERRLKNVRKMAEEINAQTANKLVSDNRNRTKESAPPSF